MVHTMSDSGIDEKLRKLPEPLRDEVLEYIEFLLERQARAKTGKLEMSWRGGLAEYRERYTSLELQRKALEWR